MNVHNFFHEAQKNIIYVNIYLNAYKYYCEAILSQNALGIAAKNVMVYLAASSDIYSTRQ